MMEVQQGSSDGQERKAQVENPTTEAASDSKNVSNLPSISAKHSGPATHIVQSNDDTITIICEVEQDEVPQATSIDPNTKCKVVTFSPNVSWTDINANLKPLDTHACKPKIKLIPTWEPFTPVPGCSTSYKRRRSDSDSNDSLTDQPPSKAQKALDDTGTEHKKKKHQVCFTFPLQADDSKPNDNQHNGNNSADAATTTPPPPKQPLKLLTAAEPMWNCAKKHRAMEQKAKLRADTLEYLQSEDITPGYFLGIDKIPRYYIRDGELPTPLTDLIFKQGRERTGVAIDYLRQEQQREKSRADYYDQATRDLYDQEGNGGYPQAEQLMVNLLTHYRSVEKKRLDALTAKEQTRRPKTRTETATLLCKEQDSFRIPPNTSSAPSRGRAPRSPPKRPRGPKNTSNSPHREKKRNKSSTSVNTKSHNSRSPARSSKAPTNQRGESGRQSQRSRRPRSRGQSPKKQDFAAHTQVLIKAIEELGNTLSKVSKK